ncbi:M48 family metallopeptidase, partial [uncultured Ruthenibacterium sp.]|uniref:M48 family metallopeptidase n=1 Tax=uncultured Ruthenibacterium sp. TaxID=1905347 RepID=UPI0025970CFA
NKEPVQYRAAGGVRYEFKRKRVKNINLRVRADGSVAVSAPLGAPLAQVDAFVAGRARWIEAARVRALARGEEEQRPCSVSREDALALFTQVSDAVFPLFAQVLNGQRPVLKVRQMKTRWGVCVPAKRQITFSLRLAEKPRAAVEYVVLHEYAHFVRADHSPAFWAVVARYMPDYKARRRLLAPSVQGGMESPEGPPPTYSKGKTALCSQFWFCRHRAVVLKWQDI